MTSPCVGRIGASNISRGGISRERNSTTFNATSFRGGSYAASRAASLNADWNASRYRAPRDDVVSKPEAPTTDDRALLEVQRRAAHLRQRSSRTPLGRGIAQTEQGSEEQGRGNRFEATPAGCAKSGPAQASGIAAQ